MSSSKTRPRLTVTLCLFSLLLYAARSGASEATYVSFQVPGSMGTYPMSVNNSMDVTGYYYASSTLVRGFVRQADGTFSTFEVAGSTYTEPEGINDAGEITGYYLAPNGNAPQLEIQGFLRYSNGQIVTFNPPCNFICNTSQPIAINAFGEITGSYAFRDNGDPAAFVRSRNGSFTTSYPQVPVGGNVDDAVATGINGSGTIVGFYEPATTGADVESFIEDA